MLKLIPVSCQSAIRLARNWGPVVSIRPAVIFPVQGVTVLILSGDASYGAMGYLPLDFQQFHFLVHFGVNLKANYPGIV